LKKRILLADRSPSVERKIASVLASEDVEITAVTDGYAAERSLDQNQPDLVLADVFLPGKSGYELCRFIKQDPRFGRLPVVLLVGSFEPFDAASAAHLGADGKLTKPIEPAGLIDMTRRFLGFSDPSSGGGDSALGLEPSTGMTDTSNDVELLAPPSRVSVEPRTDTSVPETA